MQNKQRNKYANKSLKQGYNSYNDYKGNQGYSRTITLSFNTILKVLICFIVIAIIAFYLLTKFI